MALQNLPTELLDSIFSYHDPFPDEPVLTSNHFRELRLLCRAFKRSATPLAFKRVRLCEFNREAFERIVNLSRCSEIANCVTIFEYKVVEHISPPDIHQIDSICLLGEDTLLADSKAMARDLLARHQMYLAQTDVLGTYFDILSLARALPAFSNLRTVTISAFASEPYRQYDASPTRAFWGLIKALNHCEYEITTLTIAAWHPPSLFPSAYYQRPAAETPYADSKPQQIANVVASITHLALTNIPQVYRGPWWQCALRTEIVCHCVAVESLTIIIDSERVPYADPDSSFPSFRNILFETPLHFALSPWAIDYRLPKLAHLELAATTREGAHLEDPTVFLTMHKDTLRSLVCRNYWMMSHLLRPGWISDNQFRTVVAKFPDCRFEGTHWAPPGSGP